MTPREPESHVSVSKDKILNVTTATNRLLMPRNIVLKTHRASGRNIAPYVLQIEPGVGVHFN